MQQTPKLHTTTVGSLLRLTTIPPSSEVRTMNRSDFSNMPSDPARHQSHYDLKQRNRLRDCYEHTANSNEFGDLWSCDADAPADNQQPRYCDADANEALLLIHPKTNDHRENDVRNKKKRPENNAASQFSASCLVVRFGRFIRVRGFHLRSVTWS